MNGDAEDDIRDNLKFFNRDVGDLRLVLEGYIRDGIIKECLNPSSVVYAFVGERKLKLLKVYEKNEDLRGPLKLTVDKDRLFNRNTIEACVDILNFKQYVNFEGEYDRLNFIYGLFGELSEKKPEESEKILRRFYPLLDEIAEQIDKYKDRERFLMEYKKRKK